MKKELIEVTIGALALLKEARIGSFNNDSAQDPIRNGFLDIMAIPSPQGVRRKVPRTYLRENVHFYDSRDVDMIENRLIVGEYCNYGFVVPRDKISIVFSRLFNCSPLISLIRQDRDRVEKQGTKDNGRKGDYISFLHTWAEEYNPEVVDKQVINWMRVLSKFGTVLETVFAPRRDTRYDLAVDYIRETSQRTILVNRKVGELRGAVNKNGVYLIDCGYHLWGS